VAPWRPLARVCLPAAALALAAVACPPTAGEEVEVCEKRGIATVCLRSDKGGPFRVSGEGFRPRSSLDVDIATGAGTMVPVDGDGRIPRAGSALGFLPGPDPETHLLEGTDGSGVPVSFLVTCSLGEGKRPLCRF
jgi:hypothetical protein